MLLESMIAIALIGQTHAKLDPVKIRQIYDSACAASYWARHTSANLIPGMRRAMGPAESRLYFIQLEKDCHRDLLRAADLSLCKAYHISPKTYYAILARPDIALSVPHTPETQAHLNNVDEGGMEIAWQGMMTAFDPENVRLPPRLAKRYGYKNPDDMSKTRIRDPSIMKQLIGGEEKPEAVDHP